MTSTVAGDEGDEQRDNMEVFDDNDADMESNGGTNFGELSEERNVEAATLALKKLGNVRLKKFHKHATVELFFKEIKC